MKLDLPAVAKSADGVLYVRRPSRGPSAVGVSGLVLVEFFDFSSWSLSKTSNMASNTVFSDKSRGKSVEGFSVSFCGLLTARFVSVDFGIAGDTPTVFDRVVRMSRAVSYRPEVVRWYQTPGTDETTHHSTKSHIVRDFHVDQVDSVPCAGQTVSQFLNAVRVNPHLWQDDVISLVKLMCEDLCPENRTLLVNGTISPTRGSGRDRSPHSAVPTPIVPDGVIRTEAVCLLDLIRVPGSFVGCEPRPRTGRTINLSASATTGAPDGRAWGSYLARDWPLSAFRVALAGGLKSAHWRKTSALSEPGKLHYNLT